MEMRDWMLQRTCAATTESATMKKRAAKARRSLRPARSQGAPALPGSAAQAFLTQALHQPLAGTILFW